MPPEYLHVCKLYKRVFLAHENWISDLLITLYLSFRKELKGEFFSMTPLQFMKVDSMLSITPVQGINLYQLVM